LNIFAIDPGPVKSAWVRWAGSQIHNHSHAENAEVLSVVRAMAEQGATLAIEQIACYGMAVGAETFETCVWTGRFMEAWLSRCDIPVVRVPRVQIKTHLCHSARAKDGNVRQALIDRLGQPGTKKQPGPTYGVAGDVWAALALAVYVGDREVSA
jgi:hypothetical protein